MEKRELKDRAAALMIRRQFRQALGLYDQLVESDPTDAHTHLRRADLMQRMGDATGAAEAYQLASRAFRKQGLLQHAQAALRLSERVAATGTTCTH